MDYCFPHMCCSLWLSIVFCLLFCVSVSDTKRCSYGLYSNDYRTQVLENLHLESRKFGVKDCTWGCCWENSHDVCCAFPLEIALVVLISTLCLIIVIAVMVGLIKYLLSRRKRTCVHVNGSVCRHGILGNFETRMYPGSSTILQQSYIHMDSDSHPGLTTAMHSSDSNLAVSQTHRRLSKQADATSQLLPVTPESCTNV